MDRFRTPAIVLALGLLPFWLFIGSSSSTTVNGQIVSESHFNIAGLVLGLVGAGMALSALRNDRRGDGLRVAMIVAAGLICLLQVAYSVGLVSLPL